MTCSLIKGGWKDSWESHLVGKILSQYLMNRRLQPCRGKNKVTAGPMLVGAKSKGNFLQGLEVSLPQRLNTRKQKFKRQSGHPCYRYQRPVELNSVFSVFSLEHAGVLLASGDIDPKLEYGSESTGSTATPQNGIGRNARSNGISTVTRSNYGSNPPKGRNAVNPGVTVLVLLVICSTGVTDVAARLFTAWLRYRSLVGRNCSIPTIPECLLYSARSFARSKQDEEASKLSCEINRKVILQLL
ncbi:hypothetical protein Scep_024441 [Stephania cephalantha]|uniref:Uncharacterized protein n=1 Tax=Stephania cephalantha TaxID=152367 RepID=A0AAP0HYA0_9MAGN